MRLSLNHWPPLASHVVFMLVGFSLGNFAYNPGVQTFALPRQSVVMTFERSVFESQFGPDDPKAGMHVSLVRARRNAGKRLCQVHTKSIRLFYLDSKTISLKVDEGDVAPLARLTKDKAARLANPLKLMVTKSASSPPRCKGGSLVNYAD